MENTENKGSGCAKLTGLGCLLVMALIGTLGFFAYKTHQRVQNEVAPLLTDFMKFMDAKDIAGAQQISLKGTVTDEDLQKLAETRSQFEGFQSLNIDSGGIHKRVHTDPNLDGTIAETSGTMIYADGRTAEFEARTKLVSGQWKVLSFRISVHKS